LAYEDTGVAMHASNFAPFAVFGLCLLYSAFFGFERLQPLVALLFGEVDAALRVITSSGELALLEGAVGQLLLRVHVADSPRNYPVTRSSGNLEGSLLLLLGRFYRRREYPPHLK